MEEGYEQTKIALKINPYSYFGHLFLGTGWTPKYYKEQNIEGDEETVKQIKELLKEGDEHLLNQEFNKADVAFSKILELVPSNITALIGKGTLNYHQKKYNDALRWFFKVLDINPDCGLAHHGVCQSLLRLKERKTLDFYADSNEWEYFAVGVEAYVSDEKLADQKLAYGHTRRELLERDPDLYDFIESLSQQESYLESEILAVIRKGQSLRGEDRMENVMLACIKPLLTGEFIFVNGCLEYYNLNDYWEFIWKKYLNLKLMEKMCA